MGLGPGKKRVSVALALHEHAALKTLADKQGLSVDRAIWALVVNYLNKLGKLEKG